MSNGMMATGRIEVAEQAASVTLLTGWVRLPPSNAAPLLRFVAQGQEPVVVPIRRLVDRPDQPARDADPAGRGFHLLLRGTAPWAEASAALLLDGVEVPLTPATLRATPMRPRGHLGMASRQGVAGWLFDPAGDPPMLVVDGRLRVTLPLTVNRPDLPFDDGQNRPLFGFRMTLSALGEALRALDPDITLADGKPRSVTLLASGVELGQATLNVERRLIGALESAAPGAVRGWAADLDPVAEPPMVEVLIEGTRWLTQAAALPRNDLEALGVGPEMRGGGFNAELPWHNPSDAAAPTITLRAADTRQDLPGSLILHTMPPWHPARDALRDLPAQADWPRVSIIIPIYNAAEDLARCLAAVLRHTTGPARLILIDDASPDPAIGALLAGMAGRTGVEVHRNPRNLGFTGTINRAVALAAPDDVVLLNSDTVVGPSWLDGLRVVAQSSRRIGTVTAVSNNAGAFSVPECDVENLPPAWFEPADLARLARQSALGLWPRVPTGNGFCLYVRRVCLDAVGAFDEATFPRGYGEENDFCMRATRAGFEHVVDDRTLVWHRRGASFLDERLPQMRSAQTVLAARYPEYRSLVSVFRDDAAFLAIRWRMRHALRRMHADAATPRLRVLFVLSSRSGGTPQTNRDLMQALDDRYEGWVLHSDGRELELIRHGDNPTPERHRLTRPILPGDHRSDEYDRRVGEWLLRYGFELVHVRHIAWHGLGLFEVCRALGIPVVFSFHDFYAACPTVKLLDAEGNFCGGHCTTGAEDCVPELWAAPTMPPLRDRFVHRWRAMLEEALHLCDAFVTTSPFARDLMVETFPMLASRDLRVIPHGRDFARFHALAAEPGIGECLRVLVPGHILAGKGGHLIAAMAALDAGQDVEFHVLGAVDAALRNPMPGVVLHGPYQRDAFATHVAEIRPHLAAILSTWPETYCHTLTECWAAGVPVIGTALGAVGERIGAAGGGWLVGRDTPAAEILALLHHLKRDANEVRKQREQVAEWQRGAGRHYGCAAMAASYDQIYRDVARRRRSFPEAPDGASAPVVLVLDGGDASAGFRLGLPLRNDAARGAVYRSAPPACPIGDAAACGPADLVLLPAGALPPRDMALVIERCAQAGLKLLLEVDEALAARLASGSDPGLPSVIRSALRNGAATPLAVSRRAARILAQAGLGPELLPMALDRLAWRAVLPDAPPSGADGPLRLLCFEDDPDLPMLRDALEGLVTLGVAELVSFRHPPASQSVEGAFRIQASGCALAVFGAPQGQAPLPAERRMAALAAGLPVLRRAGASERPGDTPQGEVLLAETAQAWQRAIGEISVDDARRGMLARHAALHAEHGPARMREAALDQIALRLIQSAADQVD